MMLSEIKVGLAGYLYLFACYGVDEYQFRRMKIHPVCFLSIQLIAYNGMVEPLRMSGVYAQLMGSSGLREKGNECIPVFKRNLFISGYGRFPPTVVYHLSRAVHQVWAEGKRDGSFVLLQFSLQQGGIPLLHGACFKLSLQLLVYFFGLGGKEQAGGCHIKPVDYHRACSFGI